MTERDLMNRLVRNGAQFVELGLSDNPDGPIREITTRTKTEIDYEVIIGYDGDRDRGRAVWYKTVPFGASDRHCAGGAAFVEAARQQAEVAFDLLELMEIRGAR